MTMRKSEIRRDLQFFPHKRPGARVPERPRGVARAPGPPQSTSTPNLTLSSESAGHLRLTNGEHVSRTLGGQPAQSCHCTRQFGGHSYRALDFIGANKLWPSLSVMNRKLGYTHAVQLLRFNWPVRGGQPAKGPKKPLSLPLGSPIPTAGNGGTVWPSALCSTWPVFSAGSPSRSSLSASPVSSSIEKSPSFATCCMAYIDPWATVEPVPTRRSVLACRVTLPWQFRRERGV
ncbi:hypothetical protein B0T13DRAFT_504513 [Neurospora crassa]|nr:hypothetical protein B0T13DRAFT_504513 [Neurospora crassa]